MSVPKILHLHSSFEAAGEALRCVRLINAFRREAEHAIVSGDPGRRGAAAQFAGKVKVTWPAFPPLAGRPFPERLKKLAEAMQGYDLICTYGWGAIDAAMAHTLFADLYPLPPLVHHEDGFDEDEARARKVTRNLYRRIALGRTAALVVPSRALETIALEVWRQPRSRVRRIPPGVPTKVYGKKGKPGLLPGLLKRSGEFWAGTLGGLCQVENLPATVRAFAAMPEDWQLVIAGEGPERTAILAEAERLGIEDRVHLPGSAADHAALMALFDLFVLSSHSEQFPISLVEAMAAGLPVVAAAVGDVSATVASENLPFVAPPGDERALGGALRRLAANPAARAAVGRANRAKALEEFEEARMVDRYRALYWNAMSLRP